MIKMEDGKKRYFDMHGEEIHEGDKITICEGGKPHEVYLCADGQLGLDATNPAWIRTGRASPCEYGIYPLTLDDLEFAELVGSDAM